MKRKIESLATGMVFCYATKQIVENERKVGYMYREIPEDLMIVVGVFLSVQKLRNI